MGAKRFGAVLVQPTISTIVANGVAGKDSVVVLNIANLGATSTDISIAYMYGNVTANLSNSEYLVYEYQLNSSDYFQLKGIALEAGYSLVVESSTQQVSAVTYGMINSSI